MGPGERGGREEDRGVVGGKEEEEKEQEKEEEAGWGDWGGGEISEEAALSRQEKPQAVDLWPVCAAGREPQACGQLTAGDRRPSGRGLHSWGVGGSWGLPLGMPVSCAKVCGTQFLAVTSRGPQPGEEPPWLCLAGREGTGAPCRVPVSVL